MTESRKGASSTSELKKKKSLLDEDLGDEFMNSWKSILVTEDDSVDFSFGTVSKTKSKNKAFDFGTLDDDFNLEGSFEKLSSFKMDIPDLDFPCPPKKTAKAASTCEEESPKDNSQTESSKFSFDFKELDSFDVDKSLESGERTCDRKEDTKAVSSSRVVFEDSKIHMLKENAACNDGITEKLLESGNETDLKFETFGGDHGELESEVADGTSHQTTNAKHTTNEEEQFEKRCLSEKELSKCSDHAIQDVPAQFIGRNDAPKCTSELQPEICMMGVELSEVSGGSENVTNKMIDSDGTCCENLPQNSSPINHSVPESNHTEKDKSGCSPPNEVDNIQLAEGHTDYKASSISRKLLPNSQESRENQNLKFRTPTVLLCREPLLNRMTVKEKEMDQKSLKSRTDVIGKPQIHQSSSIMARLFSLGNSKIDALNQSPSTGECNLCEDSLPRNKVMSTAPSVVVESKKSFGELSALSAQVNPSNSHAKKTPQTHCHSELPKLSMVPSRSSKIVLAQESKLCSTKTSSKFPSFSSLKTLRDFGVNQVLSSAGGEKEKKPGNLELNMESEQISKAPDINFCAEKAEKQKVLVSNLKRRALEASKADSMLLKPLKRLSMSPGGFRNCQESSEKKIEEQVEYMTTDASHGLLASSIGSPHEPNTMELEISLDLENNRNVEKAEAYTKELEDICSMLRKKHDEAKEILVRAVVNNNNLLMLNHPIHEEKIRKVQKFAAKLLSKELQTKAAGIMIPFEGMHI